MPQNNYNKRPSAKRKRAQTFQMPEDRLASVPKWKLAIGTVLFTLVCLGIGYLFGWGIGHFMKGWW